MDSRPRASAGLAERLARGGIFVSNTLDEHARVTEAMNDHFGAVVSIGTEDYDNRVLVGGPAGLSGQGSSRSGSRPIRSSRESLPILSFRSVLSRAAG